MRIVPADGEVDIFALQEQVISSIVQSSVEQVALLAGAPINSGFSICPLSIALAVLVS